MLSGKIPAAKYADKIVLIGPTAQGVGVQAPAPGYPAVTPVEMLAHMTSSILSEHYIVMPEQTDMPSTSAPVHIGDRVMVGARATVLKGVTVGRAIVSPKHANFIVNLGRATAREVADLIHKVQDQVYDKFSVNLETEVELVGQF